MKNILPYLIGGAVVFLLILVILQTGNGRKVLDQRITFNKKDKIPYGMFVAYKSLPQLFPAASISVNLREPGYWDSLSNFRNEQALLIVCPTFAADEDELNKLVNFAKGGNNVFISCRALSSAARKYFHCTSTITGLSFFSDSPEEDTLKVSLSQPPFDRGSTYNYPGKKYSAYFENTDRDVSFALGRDGEDRTNFIRLRTGGSGNIYLHLAPLVFSNYFILHGNNAEYFDQLLSVIPKDTKQLVWDEYYLRKKSPGNSDSTNSGMLSALMANRSFRFALWLLIILLVVYVLQEMRRKQRIIPVMTRAQNDSLDFVKTIGRLYHERGDHLNLGKKMSAYFLEHVRNRYKLATGELNDQFIFALQRKSGKPEANIREIVSFIQFMESAPAISDGQLADFHRELELFYSG